MPSIEILSCWSDYSKDPHANWMCHSLASHCHFEDILISNDCLLHAIWTFFNRPWNSKKPQMKSLDNLYTVFGIWTAICDFHLWRKCLHLSTTWHTDFPIMIIYDLIFLSYWKWNFRSATTQLWVFNIHIESYSEIQYKASVWRCFNTFLLFRNDNCHHFRFALRISIDVEKWCDFNSRPIFYICEI